MNRFATRHAIIIGGGASGVLLAYQLLQNHEFGFRVTLIERRPEIGLRRALGATRGHVGGQFLVEALLLSASGGLAGAAAGAGVTLAVARVHGWAPAITPASVWGGVAVAVGVGAVAGCYPALRAARLSPTDALRSA